MKLNRWFEGEGEGTRWKMRRRRLVGWCRTSVEISDSEAFCDPMTSTIRKMENNLPSAMLFLIALMITILIRADANPLEKSCFGQNYGPNSQSEHNLKLLLQSLSSNASLNEGFYSTSVGEDPDQVFGQALCRWDVNKTTCRNCIEEASQYFLHNCTNVEAMVWYELCQIQYSYERNFAITSDYNGREPETSKQRKSVPDPARNKKALNYLMPKLIINALYNSSKMFAVGEINYSENKTIYGLVQCTRKISTSHCSSCFHTASKELSDRCGENEGGIMVSANCNVRFELQRFYNSSGISLTYSNSSGRKRKTAIIVGVTCTTVFMLMGSCLIYLKRKRGAQKDEGKSELALLRNLVRPTAVTLAREGDLVSSQELPFMDLAIIRAATEDFSDSNKLGQGGFGTVYKGVLQDGKEIAIKRMSRKSWQALEEFKNEIKLIAKLQHRNLVRLLGCDIEGEERLLIYEFMPNKSLDIFIFDSQKRSQLDWKKCYEIICGIAKGLLYLHEDSRLNIIHRDLKPDNVLLDEQMVAKISDFGSARIFCENQNTANTKRVVGTYGYMAPEYAVSGLFSVKSDVFSFGVILLEIISGKRNSGFHLTGQAPTLLTYAWQQWKEGKELEFVDPFLIESCSTAEVVKCIQIGLLCVQEDPANRPNMSFVVTLLGSDQSLTLPEPRQPAISVGKLF